MSEFLIGTRSDEGRAMLVIAGKKKSLCISKRRGLHLLRDRSTEFEGGVNYCVRVSHWKQER